MEKRGICSDVISSDGCYLREKGLETICRISKDVDDGLADRLLKKIIPIPIHRTCRNTYTKPSTVRAKRKRLESDDQQNDRCVRRSQVPNFNFTPNDLNSKLPQYRRDGHRVATKELWLECLQEPKSATTNGGERSFTG